MAEKNLIRMEYLFDLEVPVRKNDVYMPYLAQDDWIKTMSGIARMMGAGEYASYIRKRVRDEKKKGNVINGATINIEINSRKMVVVSVSGASEISDELTIYDAAKEETNALCAFGKLGYLERAIKNMGCTIGHLSGYDETQISQIGGLWTVMCSGRDTDIVMKERNIDWVKNIDDLFYPK